jgi:hypothetical protein
MKLRVKIYCITAFLTALLFLGAIVFFTRSKKATILPEKKVQISESTPEKAGIRQVCKLERYSSFLENNEDFKPDAGTLAGALNACAVKIFKAVLPEKSALQMPLDIELINEYSARISGKAILFADSRKQEKYLQCRVKINFLANGSCQAEYPEFFETEK